jgi:DNA-binding CsgD family transcriptional regulator
MGRPRSSSDGWSPREREILTLASNGATDLVIAETLGISPNTVSTYWKRLYKRCGVHKRSEAVLLFAGGRSLGAPSSKLASPPRTQRKPTCGSTRRSSSICREKDLVLVVVKYLIAHVKGNVRDASATLAAMDKLVDSTLSRPMSSSWTDLDHAMIDLLVDYVVRLDHA